MIYVVSMLQPYDKIHQVPWLLDILLKSQYLLVNLVFHQCFFWSRLIADCSLALTFSLVIIHSLVEWLQNHVNVLDFQDRVEVKRYWIKFYKNSVGILSTLSIRGIKDWVSGLSVVQNLFWSLTLCCMSQQCCCYY